ncbi:MAG: urease accessory protein UreD [Clostridiaceae bacterium]|nr:urease accessory protein UreD [Clostridiaceae bacterium]
MDNEKFAGEFDIVLAKKNNETVITEKKFEGLIKISPIIHLDSEKISTFFIVGLGGGYVEGEKYNFKITCKKDSRAIITTQACTKVYKCEHGGITNQNTIIKLENNSVLEYITDSVILYKDANYKQVNIIYMKNDSTLIYTDGITSGWSKNGGKFQYSRVQFETKVYMDDKIVLLDNLIVNPKENNVNELGYFEGYENFGTLLVINPNITQEVIESIRKILSDINLDINYGISQIECNGFVLRVLGNLTQEVNKVIGIVHNYIRKEFLNSRELFVRKY